MRRYFGTDGIRGPADMFLSRPLAHTLGNSIRHTLGSKRLIVGIDTRQSSETIANAVMEGALSSGLDVTYVGVVSTPMLAHYTKQTQTTGIMVTASHNPYYDNGLKVLFNGDKLSAAKEAALDACLDAPPARASVSGRLSRPKNIMESYSRIYASLGLSQNNMRIGYDTANGALSHVAADIFVSFCANAWQIHGEPNGQNINDKCGSTFMSAIQKHVVENRLDIGFSFDGDGDRCLAVDKSGAICDGDKMVYAFAKHLKAIGQLKQNTVVLTHMSNPGIVKAFETLGITVKKTDIGDKHVAAEISKHGYSLGGENSGHIILDDVLHTGDGLLSAVYLLHILSLNNTTLEAWTSDVVMLPQQTFNVKNASKTVLETGAFKALFKQCQDRLGPTSMLLVRPSGTEPVIRVTASHEDRQLVDDVIDKLKDHIEYYSREMDV